MGKRQYCYNIVSFKTLYKSTLQIENEWPIIEMSEINV